MGIATARAARGPLSAQTRQWLALVAEIEDIESLIAELASETDSLSILNRQRLTRALAVKRTELRAVPTPAGAAPAGVRINGAPASR
ncbi:MAG: hypothetical protein AB7Q97_24825 [Gammaproteobacteria bacterium]